jgi:hypothetical protein
VLGPAATDDSSASEAPDADPITDTANEAATSTQSVSAPANDNEPAAEEQAAEKSEAEVPSGGVELARANDNEALAPLPAAGTQ